MNNTTNKLTAMILLFSHMLMSCLNHSVSKEELATAQGLCNQQQELSFGESIEEKERTNIVVGAEVQGVITAQGSKLDKANLNAQVEQILCKESAEFCHQNDLTTYSDGTDILLPTTPSVNNFSSSQPEQFNHQQLYTEKTVGGTSLHSMRLPRIVQEQQAASCAKRTTLSQLESRASAPNNTQIFIVKGGHQVQFTDTNCNVAIVDENVAPPLSRRLFLKVIKQNSNLKLKDLVVHTPAWHQHYIHIYFPEKNLNGQGCVYIGNDNWGLLGGGKEGKKKGNGEFKSSAWKLSKKGQIEFWDGQAVLRIASYLKYREMFLDICLKNEKEIEDAFDWFFNDPLAPRPVYEYGKKKGQQYTKADFINIFKSQKESSTCPCSKCRKKKPAGILPASFTTPVLPMPSPAGFSTSTNNFPNSGTNFSGQNLSGLLSHRNQFFTSSTLPASAVSSLNTNSFASSLNFSYLPPWTKYMLSNGLSFGSRSTFLIKPLGQTQTSPAENYTRLLRKTSLSNPLQLTNHSSSSSNSHLIPNPMATQTRLASPAPWQQAISPEGGQELLEGFLNLVLPDKASAQLAEYAEHCKRASEIWRSDMKAVGVESEMNLKELARQELIKERQKAIESEKEEKESIQWEEDRLQAMLEHRLAVEQAKGTIKNGKDFVTEYRSSNVEDIKEYFDYVKQELTDLPSKSTLTEEQQKEVKAILEEINKEIQEITETLVNIEYGIAHTNNAQGIHYKPEDLKTANKLLEDLRSYKKELKQLLATKGESLSDYEEEQEGETEEEQVAYRELEEEINEPTDTIELVENSHKDMQALLDKMGGSDSKCKELKQEAEQLATNVADIVEIFKAQHNATEKLYFNSDVKDYVNRPILEGVQKLQFLRAGINTLNNSMVHFCKQFVIQLPVVPSILIITKETLKEAFNMLVDLIVPGSELVKAALGTCPLPQTRDEWIGLALTLGLEFIPFGKALKLLAGPAKAVVHNKVKALFLGFLKRSSKKSSSIINKIQLGNKLDYIFGKATGSIHNIERSTTMLRQLNSIGIFDNAAGNLYLKAHLAEVYKSAKKVIQSNGRVLKESLLMGPNGGLKMESIWEGNKLITIKLLGK